MEGPLIILHVPTWNIFIFQTKHNYTKKVLLNQIENKEE